MKNKIIFLFPLLLTTIVGCSPKGVSHTFEFVVLQDADRRTYAAGEMFDTTGLKIGFKCTDCGEVLEEPVWYENNVDLEVGQESITIKSNWGGGDYTIEYPITVKEKFHIACIGDSLTYGHMWRDKAYPVYLSNKVSKYYEVGNFSYNGLSITGYGGSFDNPDERYIVRDEYKQSLAFKPDVFAIMLGTNDATGWAKAEPTFYDEYKILLDSYIEEIPDAQFIMMVSPPCISPNQFSIPNDVINDSVNPIQRDLADEYGFEVLDLREEFEAHENYESDYLRPNDGVHFTEMGAEYVANRVWEIVQNLKF